MFLFYYHDFIIPEEQSFSTAEILETSNALYPQVPASVAFQSAINLVQALDRIKEVIQIYDKVDMDEALYQEMTSKIQVKWPPKLCFRWSHCSGNYCKRGRTKYELYRPYDQVD